ncbi:hypothetical protein QUB47_07185 [Microcoleus sp. AT9_B5]
MRSPEEHFLQLEIIMQRHAAALEAEVRALQAADETAQWPLDQDFLDGTRHVIYPWNQSKIENRKSSSPRIYPWGQSKISNLKSQIE